MAENVEAGARVLTRELALAERTRARAMALALSVGAVTGLFMSQDVPQATLRAGVTRWQIVLLCVPSVIGAALEALGAYAAGRRAERGEAVPALGIWLAVTLESLLPTLVLLYVAQRVQVSTVFGTPVILTYGVIMTISALRLDYKLCLYSGAVCSGSHLLLAWWLTREGYLLDAVDTALVPNLMRALFLAIAGVASAIVAWQLRGRLEHAIQALEQRNWVVGVFGRYLSDDVVDRLLHDPEALRLGGVKTGVTLLMTDLRGFSNIAEPMDPARVVTLLNHYLGAMTSVIQRHDGTIDEFIGDAILVVFNAPLPQADHARRALRCAVEMQREMDAVNAWNQANGLPTLGMGIGVHTGDVVVGNIGSPQRQKYGVVGATVNLAARVESYTVGGQVLATEAVVVAAGEGLEIGGEHQVFPKGASQPLRLLDVQGVGELRLPQRLSTLRPIAPLEVRIRPLIGKDLSPDATEGTLHALSADEGLLRCPLELTLWQNLALELEGGVAFAKVTALGPEARLRFTTWDQRAAAARDRALSARAEPG